MTDDEADHMAAEISRLTTENEALRDELAEARRRRDEWQKKAEGYDAIRKALREKVGAPWPPNLSRAMWAGLAADEKKRADDAEAEVARLREALDACNVTALIAHALQDGDIHADVAGLWQETLDEMNAALRAALRGDT